MGQNQSRDGIAVAAAAATATSGSVGSKAAAAIDAYIILRQRPDGSSVREIFVPDWRAGFYKVGTSVVFSLDCDILTTGSGKYISIDAESAAELYKALLSYRIAVASASPVITKYVEGAGFFKL